MKKRITIGLVGIALCATASAADKVRLHFEEGAFSERRDR